MNAAKAAAKLKRWRGNRSLLAAAIALGCHPSYLMHLERGTRKPGRDFSLKLQDVVGIPPSAWSRGGTHRRTVGDTLTCVNRAKDACP